MMIVIFDVNKSIFYYLSERESQALDGNHAPDKKIFSVQSL